MQQLLNVLFTWAAVFFHTWFSLNSS